MTCRQFFLTTSKPIPLFAPVTRNKHQAKYTTFSATEKKEKKVFITSDSTKKSTCQCFYVIDPNRIFSLMNLFLKKMIGIDGMKRFP
jgi:hypothetical protein